MKKYRIFTLNVLSDFAFDFEEADFQEADVIFRRGPSLGKEPVKEPIMEFINQSHELLIVDIHNVAEFHIHHNDIVDIYSYMDNTHVNEIALHLLGNIFALIMYRRNVFVLHGSCVSYKEKSLIITGDGGAGKSTLARGFIDRGHKVVTDDLAFIDDQYYVLPSYPSQKLWQDAMDNYGVEEFDHPIYSRQNKYNVSSKKSFLNERIPVGYVVMLCKHDGKVKIEEVKGMDKLNLLLENAYREEFLGMYDLEVAHLQFMVKLAGHVKVYKLYRPSEGFTVDQQITSILEEC